MIHGPPDPRAPLYRLSTHHSITRVVTVPNLSIPVLGLDVIRKCLGLLVSVVIVSVVVVVRRSNVLHLVDAAALGASLDWALAVHLEASCVSPMVAFESAGSGK